jgi:hypothetical protein
MTTRILKLAAIVIFLAGLAAAFMPRSVAAEEHGVSVTVKGESWDADSRGFAYIAGLSKKEGERTSARRGSRISVDGEPDKFAISGPGPGFELTFTTTKPSFRLIVEGDRFPRVLTQSYEVPKGGGELDIGRIDAPRAEGPEHTWPLPMAATELGYDSALDMMADNKAAIRILVMSSGTEGAPDIANDSIVSIEGADARVLPFDMDTKVTFFQLTGPRIGAFLVVVPFADGETPDKDVIIKVTDTVTETTWDPPRPWFYDPVVVSLRNGFSTPTIRIYPKID